MQWQQQGRQQPGAQGDGFYVSSDNDEDDDADDDGGAAVFEKTDADDDDDARCEADNTRGARLQPAPHQAQQTQRAVRGAAAHTLPPRLAFRSAQAPMLCARHDAHEWNVAQVLCWLKHTVRAAPDGLSVARLYGAAFADAAVDGVVLLSCLCDDDLRQEPFCITNANHRSHIMRAVTQLRDSTRQAARKFRA